MVRALCQRRLSRFALQKRSVAPGRAISTRSENDGMRTRTLRLVAMAFTLTIS